MTCNNCGAELDIDAESCYVCASPVDADSAEPPPSGIEEMPPLSPAGNGRKPGILKIVIPVAAVFLSEGDLESIADEESRRAEAIGADMVTGCIAVVEMGGDMFLFSPDTVRYGSKWYIRSLSDGAVSVALYSKLDPCAVFSMGGILPMPAALNDMLPSLLEAG